MTQAREYKVVGTRPVRHDGAENVTGLAQFGADVSLPNTLHGQMLRSPHAHERHLPCSPPTVLKAVEEANES